MYPLEAMSALSIIAVASVEQIDWVRHETCRLRLRGNLDICLSIVFGFHQILEKTKVRLTVDEGP